MKSLLDLSIVSVLNSLTVLKVKEPITVQEGLHYLMFMQAIAEELKKVGGDPMNLLLERIIELAKEHGGYVQLDLSELQDGSLIQAMLQNSEKEVFFTRLAHYISSLLKE